MLKSATMTAERGFEPRRTINQKEYIGDVVFQFSFLEKHLDAPGRSLWKEVDVQDVAGHGIDGSVQPEPFIIERHYDLVNRGVIR